MMHYGLASPAVHLLLWRSYMGGLCFLLALLCSGCATVGTGPTSTHDAFHVVGYAPDYSMERIYPGAYDLITDAILFSAVLNDDGTFPEEAIATLPVARFQQLKQDHGLRIHLCFGGWGRSGGFAEMTGDAEKRKAFIEALVQWCVANGFDGVDYDWEFPANREEHVAYSALLRETAEALRLHGLWVTVALGHTQALDQSAYDAVDGIHLMTYDMGVRHATEQDAASSLRRLIRSGAPRDKIVLGVPFYGRMMADRDAAMAYKDILERFSPAPDEDEAGGFYFNNMETLRRKTRFAIAEGLAGIMIWELSMDVDNDRSLLRVIDEERNQ